jgi:hypothetical protein
MAKEEIVGRESMETLDTALTYAINLVMVLGGGYIGTAFLVHMVDRWKKLEVPSKLNATQEIKIPLNLKAAEAIPLELEQTQVAVAKQLEPEPSPVEPVAPVPKQEAPRDEPEPRVVSDRPIAQPPKSQPTGFKATSQATSQADKVQPNRPVAQPPKPRPIDLKMPEKSDSKRSNVKSSPVKPKAETDENSDQDQLL